MKKLFSLFVVVSCLFVEGISQTVRSFQREDNRVVLKMTDGENYNFIRYRPIH